MNENDKLIQKITKCISLEKQVMSKILNNPNLYITNAHLFKIRLFREDALCREVFPIFQQIIGIGKTPDLVTISNELKSEGAFNGLVDLYGLHSSNFNLLAAIDMLRDRIVMNELTQLLYVQDTWEGTSTELIEYIQTQLIKLSDTGGQESQHISIKLSDLLKVIEHNKTVQGLTGIGTGMQRFDNYTGGFQKGDLIIIGAETSVGKTSLALSIVNKACMVFGKRAGIYSLEMTSVQIAARLGAMNTDISAKKLLMGKLSDEETERINSDWRSLNKSGIYISECTSSDVTRIATSIRALKIQSDIELAVIDYLQLTSTKTTGGNRNRELADASRLFKNLAKELGISVILLSQMNRDKNNRFPTLSRLRDSGEIEEAADTIMLIYRPEAWDETTYHQPQDYDGQSCIGNALIMVAKGRNIGTFNFIQDFDKEKTLFSEPNNYNGGTDAKPF